MDFLKAKVDAGCAAAPADPSLRHPVGIMATGSFDRTPPPFFRQGPSALTKLALCSALAIFLMAADTRFALTQPLRALLATALHPIQRTLLACGLFCSV